MGNNKYKVLIIEDEANIRSFIGAILESNGYQVLMGATCAQGRMMFSSHCPDLVLLDLGLPDEDGTAFIRTVRESGGGAPILVLSARSDERDKIEALDLGANDYITKPFNVQIAMQRIQAVLRRTMGNKEEHIYRCGNLVIDFETRTVTKSGEKLALTPTEFKLLYVFVKNENMALTRNLLLEKLWDSEGNFVDEHTLTINISRLRAKIKDAQYKYIKTLYGMGYQWIGVQNE